MASSKSCAGTSPAPSESASESESSNHYIYKEYGGFRNFMLSYRLKMWNDDDVQEAKAIADEMRKQDMEEATLARATSATTDPSGAGKPSGVAKPSRKGKTTSSTKSSEAAKAGTKSTSRK